MFSTHEDRQRSHPGPVPAPAGCVPKRPKSRQPGAGERGRAAAGRRRSLSAGCQLEGVRSRGVVGIRGGQPKENSHEPKLPGSLATAPLSPSAKVQRH
jgi:hypothetical protein